jgi:hypothetical protein
MWSRRLRWVRLKFDGLSSGFWVVYWESVLAVYPFVSLREPLPLSWGESTCGRCEVRVFLSGLMRSFAELELSVPRGNGNEVNYWDYVEPLAPRGEFAVCLIVSLLLINHVTPKNLRKLNGYRPSFLCFSPWSLSHLVLSSFLLRRNSFATNN